MNSTATLVRTYTQLTQEQSYQISALKGMGHSRNEIAQVVEVHRSTISRELGRNTGERGYRPKQAHEKAIGRRAKVKPRIAATTWEVVEEKLREDWSPEQVSGCLKKRQGISISHEWINQHILADTQCPADKQVGSDFYAHLRCQPALAASPGKKRRKRYGKHDYRRRPTRWETAQSGQY